MVTLRTKRHWSGRKCRRRGCFAPPFLVVRGTVMLVWTQQDVMTTRVGGWVGLYGILGRPCSLAVGM
jgi:hypothetical protein